MKSKHYDKKMFRLIYILNQLNKNKYVKTVELADEFNTNIRTVQRDIALLNEVGFPLYGENGKYQFMDGFSLRKVSVSSEEKYLLTILYRLFSGAEGASLQVSSKSLLDKILVSPAENPNIGLVDRKRDFLDRQIDKLAKQIEVDFQEDPRSEAFEDEIILVVKDIKSKILILNEKYDINGRFSQETDPESSQQVCVISIPKIYFSIPKIKLDWQDKETDIIFRFLAVPPNKYFSTFRIAIHTSFYYKFFGPFMKPKRFTCFDKFIEQIGFSSETKKVNYEYSYGNEEFLITRIRFDWEKVIDVPKLEREPFLKKKMLVSRSKGYEVV